MLITVVPDIKEDAVRVEPKRRGANKVLPIRVDAVVDVTEMVFP